MTDPISRDTPADVPSDDLRPEAGPESSIAADPPVPDSPATDPASGLEGEESAPDAMASSGDGSLGSTPLGDETGNETSTVEPDPVAPDCGTDESAGRVQTSPDEVGLTVDPDGTDEKDVTAMGTSEAMPIGDLAPEAPADLPSIDPAAVEPEVSVPKAVQPPVMVPDIRVDLLTVEPLTPQSVATLKRRVMRSVRHARHFQTILDRTYGPESREEAQFLRGVGLWLLSRHHGAAEALEGHRGHPVADYLLAEMLLRDAHVQEAVDAFNKLVAKHPKEPLFWQGLAESLDKSPDDEAFEKAVRSYLALDDEDPGAHFLKGMLAERQGDYDEAEQRYATAVVMDRDCDGARFRLAQHHYLRGDEEKAVELYEELTMRPPSSASALVNLGIIHEDREEYDDAATCYRAVLDYYPDHTRARMYLRDVLASKEMYYDEEKERKEDKKAQILRIPVTDFELSVRSRNCLAKMNIRTLGDLIKKSETELLAFKNFGETSLAEIKEILRQKNLRLGMVTEEEEQITCDPNPPPDPDSVMNKPLSDLDLSVRSRKACEFIRVHSVGDLARISESELLACKNFGQTSLNELKKKLADMGLSLRS